MVFRILPLCTSVLAVLGAPAVTQAAVNYWTSIGPQGGVVNALVVDVANSSVLYAGTAGGGVYKSADGAATWRPANVGLLPLNPTGTDADVLSIVQDRAHPSTLYAGTRRGVFKSVNGAATWYRLVSTSYLDDSFPSIAVLPGNPSRVFWIDSVVGVFGTLDGEIRAGMMLFRTLTPSALAGDALSGTAFVGTDSGVAFSRDGGVTWAGPLGPPSVRSIAVDPSNSALVYAGTGSGTLFRSSDAGQTWVPWGGMNFLAPVRVIRVDPASGLHLFAGTLQAGFESLDGGATWRPVALGSVGLADVAFDSSNPGKLYAATIGKGVSRSLDAGATWTTVTAGLPGVPISSLASDLRVPATIYAGVSTTFDALKSQSRFPGGLYRSDDAGATWAFSPIADGFDPQYLAIDSGSPSIIYAGGNGFSTTNGLYRSADGGNTWTALTSFPGPAFGGKPEVTSIAAVPGRPGSLYVTADTGPFPGSSNGGLFRSFDAGDTWQRLYDGSAGPVAVDPTAQATVFLAVHETVFGILKSTDGGATFHPTVGSPAEVAALQIDPASPSNVYATEIFSDSPWDYGDPTFGNLFGVFRSVDSGVRWMKGPQAETLSGPLLADASIPGVLFAGGYGQVSRTADGGSTWSSLGSGLDGRRVTSLAVDPTTPQGLYAGTSSGGIFRYAISEPVSQCAASATKLCLHRGRFSVRAFSQLPGGYPRSAASAIPVGDDAGQFSFFTPGNPELVVKIVDGSDVNGNVWLFVGPTSNVLYAVEVLDRQTGAAKTYINPGGTLASIADTSSFPADVGMGEPPIASVDLAQAFEGPSPCGGPPGAACLYLNRFRVDIHWRTRDGREGDARTLPLTSYGSAFWFFSPNSPEYLVKVLDGRPINGHFWVFIGSLTDVESRVTITDSQTGVTRIYFNPAGEMTSLVDAQAF
jgi:photosystem II stability/assembly factor-like uncharacterized protein